MITFLFLIFAGIPGNGFPSSKPPSPEPTANLSSAKLPEHWFMGTATGDDRVLEICSSTKLRFRRGGCGYFGPWIESTWSRNDDKIFFDSPELKKEFGSFLIIAKYKSNPILIPEKNRRLIKAKRFPPTDCFWVNLLGAGGLELSKDSHDFSW